VRKALPRTFFARPATLVAPELLGTVLVRTLPNGLMVAAKIVETEAYEHDDPASHSFRGPTPRNATMFGPPGRLYVYFTYGMHHCMNVVTGLLGVGSAVLLRAGEPLIGIEEMIRLRGRADSLCSGPARWCQAFDIDRSLDGSDLVAGSEIKIEVGEDPGPIEVSTRVGVREGAELLRRFFVSGNRSVSRPARRPAVARPWTP
jgi:DNA-3-methyladenine glycosylase